MPGAKCHDVPARRKQAWDLYKKGYTYQQIAEMIPREDGKKWHWRSIENDVKAVRSKAVVGAPDWYQDAAILGKKTLGDLCELRDLGRKALTEDPEGRYRTDPRAYTAMLQTLGNLDNLILDRTLPSKAMVEQVGAQKIEWIVPTVDPNTPLCTKCGTKHYPSVACEGVSFANSDDSIQTS